MSASDAFEIDSARTINRLAGSFNRISPHGRLRQYSGTVQPRPPTAADMRLLRVRRKSHGPLICNIIMHMAQSCTFQGMVAAAPSLQLPCQCGESASKVSVRTACEGGGLARGGLPVAAHDVGGIGGRPGRRREPACAFRGRCERALGRYSYRRLHRLLSETRMAACRAVALLLQGTAPPPPPAAERPTAAALRIRSCEAITVIDTARRV